MKTQRLTVNLTAQLQRFVEDQVRGGRYEDESEVVRDAVRQMQQREIDGFDRAFGNYPGAPHDEPTRQDEQAIQDVIKRHRTKKTRQRAA